MVGQRLLDGGDPTVHHVGGRHDVRPRPGEGEGLAGEQGQGGGVVDGPI